jgi:glycosyltransferase involved in cell wall biosynthesis
VPKTNRLAVVATHLRPAQGFGGVAESVSELIKAWRAVGREVTVVVCDGTLGPTLTRRDFEQELHGSVTTYRAMLALRWGFGPTAPIAIARTILTAERVYIAGVATWPTTCAALIARLFGRPYVVALRGGVMAEHWKVICDKRPLKALFYRAFVFPAMRNAAAVHVSSSIEAQDALAAEPRCHVFIAPNAFDIRPPSPEQLRPITRKGLRLLYLGRLSSEKGILSFARRFAQLRQPEDELLVAGPSEGAYGAEAVRTCEASPGLTYLGVLARRDVPSVLRDVHALVLPSGADGDIRENFGNVIVEALGHGRPVLVTRGLAWDELEPAGIGALFDRSLEDLQPALDRLRALVKRDDVWSMAASYAQHHFAPGAVAETVWSAVFSRSDA